MGMYLDYHIYCVFDNSFNPGRQQLFYLPNICFTNLTFFVTPTSKSNYFVKKATNVD